MLGVAQMYNRVSLRHLWTTSHHLPLVL